MKKLVFIIVILFVSYGCASTPSEGAVKTAILEAMAADAQSNEILTDTEEQKQATITESVAPTETPTPTPSGEERFLS